METSYLPNIHKCSSKCLEEIRIILNLTIDAFAFDIRYSVSGYRRLVGLDNGFKNDSPVHFDLLKIIESIIINTHSKFIWKEHKNKILNTILKNANKLLM